MSETEQRSLGRKRKLNNLIFGPGFSIDQKSFP